MKTELRIVELFLEKLEKLSDRERGVLINSIEILNHPVFITDESINRV